MQREAVAPKELKQGMGTWDHGCYGFAAAVARPLAEGVCAALSFAELFLL